MLDGDVWMIGFRRGTVRAAFLVAVVVLSVCAAASALPAHSAPNRLVLAFYYPWYDQNTWNDPAVPDHPPDRYRSTDEGVMARQIDQARGANIDAFVSAWYGPQVANNQTETNLRSLLWLSQPRSFAVGALVEVAGPFFHSSDDVRGALAYLLATHATRPSYLRWNGKPVIFFWAPGSLRRPAGQSAAAAWQAIRAQVDPDHTSLWIADGFDMGLMSVFDGGYLYNIAWADDPGAPARQWAARVRAAGRLWVGTVMPGWDDTRILERAGRYRRDRQGGGWYAASWTGAASANPEMVAITSWNEFIENTYIEPSAQFGSQYLDLTRSLAGAWKVSAPVKLPDPATAQAVVRPRPTPVPTPVPALPAPVDPPVTDAELPECADSMSTLCFLR
jgi:Glycosyl hydrolase family 99